MSRVEVREINSINLINLIKIILKIASVCLVLYNNSDYLASGKKTGNAKDVCTSFVFLNTKVARSTTSSEINF